MGPSPHRFSGPLGLNTLRTDAPTVTATTRTRSRALAAGDAVSRKRRPKGKAQGHASPRVSRARDTVLENDE